MNWSFLCDIISKCDRGTNGPTNIQNHGPYTLGQNGRRPKSHNTFSIFIYVVQYCEANWEMQKNDISPMSFLTNQVWNKSIVQKASDQKTDKPTTVRFTTLDFRPRLIRAL